MDRLSTIGIVLVVLLLLGCKEDEINEPEGELIESNVFNGDTLKVNANLGFVFTYREGYEVFSVELDEKLIFQSTLNNVPGENVSKRITFDTFDFANGTYFLKAFIRTASGEDIEHVREVKIVNSSFELQVDDNYFPENTISDYTGRLYVSTLDGITVFDEPYFNGQTLTFRDNGLIDEDQYYVHLESRSVFGRWIKSYIIPSNQLVSWSITPQPALPGRSSRFQFDMPYNASNAAINISDDSGSITSNWNGHNESFRLNIPFKSGENDVLISYFSEDFNVFNYLFESGASDGLDVIEEDFTSMGVNAVSHSGRGNMTIAGYNSASDWNTTYFEYTDLYVDISPFPIPTGLDDFQYYFSNLTSIHEDKTYEQYTWGETPTEFQTDDYSYEVVRNTSSVKLVDNNIEFILNQGESSWVEVLIGTNTFHMSIFIPAASRKSVIPLDFNFSGIEIKGAKFHNSDVINSYEEFVNWSSEGNNLLSPDHGNYRTTAYSLDQN